MSLDLKRKYGKDKGLTLTVKGNHMIVTYVCIRVPGTVLGALV